jgi:carbon monoxide dehydrogenase subunit G
MATFVHERKINFPRAEVWSRLGDFSHVPGPGITVEVEKEGDTSAAGAGTIRTITIGKMRVREILEAASPPHSFTYRILSGAPVKEYKADVTLEETDGGTLVRWQGDLKPKIPLTGGLLCGVAKGSVDKLLDAVEAALAKP